MTIPRVYEIIIDCIQWRLIAYLEYLNCNYFVICSTLCDIEITLSWMGLFEGFSVKKHLKEYEPIFLN